MSAICNGKDCEQKLECANYDPSKPFPLSDPLCGYYEGEHHFNFVKIETVEVEA